MLPLAETIAKNYGPYCGIEDEEAYSILAEELVRYADDYLILWREGNKRIITTRFRQILRQNARADRIRKLAEECDHRYPPEYVRLFLPFFFARSDWAAGPPDHNGSKPGWQTADAIDTALDIQRAWRRLKSWQESVILARHLTDPRDAHGETDWEAVADECGYASPDAARIAYSKATFQLSVEMTGQKVERAADHSGPGARKAISNSQAHGVLHSLNN